MNAHHNAIHPVFTCILVTCLLKRETIIKCAILHLMRYIPNVPVKKYSTIYRRPGRVPGFLDTFNPKRIIFARSVNEILGQS